MRVYSCKFYNFYVYIYLIDIHVTGIYIKDVFIFLYQVYDLKQRS